MLGLQRERELAQGWISARQQACRHSYEHAQDPPVASCQADVAGSDHYVLILAARYGTRQSDHGHKSVTELEFEAALAAGCTLHAFFLNFSSDLANAIDDDAGRARLDAFKQRVQRHCRAQLCRSEAEFSDAIKLLAAAPPPRPADSPADPTLPQRDTPHNLPFRNQSGDGLLGREQALAQLEALLGDGGGPVLITGMDGVGKTALALHHLRRRMDHYRAGIVLLDGQLQADRGCRRRVVWAERLALPLLAALVAGAADPLALAERLQIPHRQHRLLAQWLQLRRRLPHRTGDLTVPAWCALLESPGHGPEAVALALAMGDGPRRPLLRWLLRWRSLRAPRTAAQLLAEGWRPGPELGAELQRLRSLRLAEERC